MNASCPPSLARRRRESGTLMTECLVALSILVLAAFPLSFAFVQDATYLRACYYRALAMGIVDGEAEMLAAGGWKAFDRGRHDYKVQAPAATNLPPGQFSLEVSSEGFRLDWTPQRPNQGTRVTREVRLP